jgi:hypothetical protein
MSTTLDQHCAAVKSLLDFVPPRSPAEGKRFARERARQAPETQWGTPMPLLDHGRGGLLFLLGTRHRQQLRDERQPLGAEQLAR